MKFNMMGIIFMMIAIALGSFIGAMIAGWFGMAGGLFGSIIVGFIIYAIWAFLSGQKIRLWAGVIFALMVWIANIIAGTIFGATGFGGGIIGLAITAVVLSFLWGKFGKGMSGGTGKRSGKRKRRH